MRRLQILNAANLLSEYHESATMNTAECERAFSTMKRITTALRNRLITVNLEHLMRISINGPDIQNLKFIKEATSWSDQGQRIRSLILSAHVHNSHFLIIVTIIFEMIMKVIKSGLKWSKTLKN